MGGARKVEGAGGWEIGSVGGWVRLGWGWACSTHVVA